MCGFKAYVRGGGLLYMRGSGELTAKSLESKHGLLCRRATPLTAGCQSMNTERRVCAGGELPRMLEHEWVSTEQAWCGPKNLSRTVRGEATLVCG